MDRAYHHGAFRSKKSVGQYPLIYIDKDADFASVKIAPGVESRSYVKDGFVFCENQDGQIIEIQILNISKLRPQKKKHAA